MNQNKQVLGGGTSGIKPAISGSSGWNRSHEGTSVAGTFQGECTEKWRRVLLTAAWGSRNLDEAEGQRLESLRPAPA